MTMQDVDQSNKTDEGSDDKLGQRSEKEEGGSAEEEMITISKKDFSDKLSKAGNDRTNQRIRDLEAENKRLKDKEANDAFERELAAIPEDQKDRRTNVQLRKENQGLRDQLDEYRPYKDKVEQYEKEQASIADANAIASKYEGITAKELLDMTDGSKAKMEALAKRLGTPAEHEKEEVGPVKTDTGRTLGASQNEKNMTSSQMIQKGLDQEARRNKKGR